MGILSKIFGSGTDLKEVQGRGAVILDVRTAAEYKGGHVKGSKHIPLDRLSGQIKEVKKWNKPVITCCASGMRSGSAARLLKEQGIEAYNGGSWTAVNNL